MIVREAILNERGQPDAQQAKESHPLRSFPLAIRPVEVIAYCENHVLGFFVDVYEIDDVQLLNRHAALLNVCAPSVVLRIIDVGEPD